MRGLKKLSLAMIVGLSGLGINYTSQRQLAIEDFKSKYDSALIISGTTLPDSMRNVPSYSRKFNEKAGTIVYSSRNDGIDYLVSRSKNSRTEDVWTFVPEISLWINMTSISGKGISFQDRFLNSATNLYKHVEIYHTHLDKSVLDPRFERDSIVLGMLSIYGESANYIPSPMDSYTDILKKIEGPNNAIHGIVSSYGVMRIELDSMPAPSILAISLKAFKVNEIMTLSLLDYFKGYSLKDMPRRAKEYDGPMRLEFELRSTDDE